MPDREQWWLTWDLHVVRNDNPPKTFDAPDVNIFRLSFTSAREAATFKAEIQRWLGSVLLASIQHGRVQLAPDDSAALSRTGEEDA
jgi:hypothetical protein